MSSFEISSFILPRKFYLCSPLLSGGITQASGVRNSISLLTQVQPGRIDFVIQPNIERLADDGLPDLLESEAAFGTAEALVQLLSPILTSCFRVAMVSNLSKMVDTADEAAAEVIEHIGVPLQVENLTDLSFSANLRKTIRQDLVMNRLMRLSVLQVQLVNSVSTGFNQEMMSSQISKFAGLLTLDFNSVPLNRSLTPAEQIEMFAAITDETRRFNNSARAIECLQ